MKRSRGEENSGGVDGRVGFHSESSKLKFTPLGSGNEVGRSCHLLEFKGKSILLDCGIHPGRKGENSLPFFDTFGKHFLQVLHCATPHS